MSSLTPSSVSGPGGTHYRRYSSVQRRNRVRRGEKNSKSAHFCGSAVFLRIRYFSLPSPAIRSVISSIRSSGKGGEPIGFIATLISFMGLSSAAILLELSAPQRRQRCMTAHSPFFRTQTAIGSMIPPQPLSRSPGSIST